MAHQIAVFVENKPGRLQQVTRVLAEANVNIRAITIADAGQFGVIKLLVDQPELAYERLRAAKMVAHKKEILAVLMDDRPGGLHRVASALEPFQINISDAYGFVIEDRKRAVLVLDVDERPEVEQIIAQVGLKTLTDEELYTL